MQAASFDVDADLVFQEDYSAYLREQLNVMTTTTGLDPEQGDSCENSCENTCENGSDNLALNIAPGAQSSFRLEGFRMIQQGAVRKRMNKIENLENRTISLNAAPEAQSSFRLDGFRMIQQGAGCEYPRGSMSSAGSQTSISLNTAPEARSSFRLEGFRMIQQGAGCENHKRSMSSAGFRASISTIDTTAPPLQASMPRSQEDVLTSATNTGLPSSKHWMLRFHFEVRSPKHA